MPRKPSPPDPHTLAARIESFDQTYFIADGPSRVDDEALIMIIGRIERISPKLKQYLDQQIDITFACARSYASDGSTQKPEKPFLLPINLSKRNRSFMVYLPSAPFWSIPTMIASGKITHIEARFEAIRYGSGNLLSINLTPASRMDEL